VDHLGQVLAREKVAACKKVEEDTAQAEDVTIEGIAVAS
jgi:hypothetical protein